MVCFTSFLSELCLPCFPSRVHGIPLLGRIVPGRTGYGKSVLKIGKTTFKRWFEFEKIELQINLVINFSKFQYKSGCRCSLHKCQPPFCPPQTGGESEQASFSLCINTFFIISNSPFLLPLLWRKLGRGFPPFGEVWYRASQVFGSFTVYALIGSEPLSASDEYSRKDWFYYLVSTCQIAVSPVRRLAVANRLAHQQDLSALSKCQIARLQFFRGCCAYLYSVLPVVFNSCLLRQPGTRRLFYFPPFCFFPPSPWERVGERPLVNHLFNSLIC